MPRNSQFIRQWKILRYIADGQIDIVNINLPELQEVFNVHSKTIRRDIRCLFSAGFLQVYSFPQKEKKKKYVQRHGLKNLVREIAARSKDEIVDADLLCCNSCTYRFKTENGKLDMVDFRAHKATHQ